MESTKELFEQILKLTKEKGANQGILTTVSLVCMEIVKEGPNGNPSKILNNILTVCKELTDKTEEVNEKLEEDFDELESRMMEKLKQEQVFH